MKQDGSIHKGHRERLRQRIQRQGLDSLEPHEILEFLLNYAIPRQNTNPLAHELITRFGNLNNVLSAGMDELQQVKGVGPRTALWLSTLGETVRCFRSLDPNDRPRIARPVELFRHAAGLRAGVMPPCTMQLCLDGNGYLVLQRQLTASRAWAEPEHLRLALEDMLRSRSLHSVILQFTAPEHDCVDQYDIQYAGEYAATLRSLGCILLDVVLVNTADYISLREKKMLPDFGIEPHTTTLREGSSEFLQNYANAQHASLEEDQIEATEDRL